MKREPYYFESIDSEICYNEDYFFENMIDEGKGEIEVFEAVPEKMTDVFWCKAEMFCGDNSGDTCGKQCPSYKPRNGKSGCCKHYTKHLYTPGGKITLKLKP